MAKEKIAILDKDKRFGLYLKNSLNNLGYRAVLANDPVSGYNLLWAETPKLLIIDPAFEKSDFKLLFTQLLKTAKDNSFPILVISDTKIVTQVKKLAKTDSVKIKTLEKPSDFEQIKSIINDLLRLSESNHQADENHVENPNADENLVKRIKTLENGKKPVKKISSEYSSITKKIEPAFDWKIDIKKGSFHKTNICLLVNRLYMQRKTGILTIKNDDNVRQLYFLNGNIVFARSNRLLQRLDTILLRSGRLTQKDLQAAEKIQKEKPNKRFGQILVELGLLTENELEIIIKLQVQKIILDTLHFMDGSYSFKFSTIPLEEKIKLNISTANLIMSYIRTVESYDYISHFMPPASSVPALNPDPIIAFQRVNLSNNEQKILSLINSVRTQEEVIKMGKLSIPRVEILLFGLYCTSIIYVKSLKEIEGAQVSQVQDDKDDAKPAFLDEYISEEDSAEIISERPDLADRIATLTPKFGGNLIDKPIAELMAMLIVKKMDGILAIDHGMDKTIIELSKGNFVDIKTTQEQQGLSFVLLQANKISKADYKQVKEFQRRKPNRSEESAVLEFGLISKDELMMFRSLYLKGLLLKLFEIAEGKYYFYTLKESEPIGLHQIEGEDIILEGIRNLKDLSYIKKALPSRNLLVTLTDKSKQKFISLSLSMRERQLYSFINNMNTIEDIHVISGLPEEVVLKTIYMFKVFGLVKLEEKAVVKEPQKVRQSTESSGIFFDDESTPWLTKEKLVSDIQQFHKKLRLHNYYELLGVSRDADVNSIRNSYRKLAFLYHPDTLHARGLEDLADQATEILSYLNRAYEVLSNPQSRKQYDLRLKEGRA